MFSPRQILSTLAACMLVAGCGTGGPFNTVPEKKPAAPVKFDYQIHNRDNVGLMRAFDDGQKTILQFQNLESLPVEAFDSESNPISGVRRVGSYLILPQVYRTVFVRVGKKESAAVRLSADNPDLLLGEPIGKARAVATATPAAATATPTVATNSNPTPSAAPSTTPSTAPAAQGTTTAVASVATTATATVPATEAVAPAAKVWSVKRTDRILRQTLERWAAEANKELPAGERHRWSISWEVDRRFDIGFETEYTGSIEDAVLEMMKDTRTGTYHLTSCIYDNRVIRVIRRGDVAKCKIS